MSENKRKPTIGVEQANYPQRHLVVLDLEKMKTFELFFDNDYECFKFKNKCSRGNKLLITADYCDLGYES